MAATAAMVAAVRRMVAEPTAATYSDSTLEDLIEAQPLTDENGAEAYTDVYMAGTVTTRVANTSWIPTYDLNAVASAIWAEKANLLAGNFDFSADGANYSRAQAFEQHMKQSRYYGSRRSPRGIVQEPAYKRPSEIDE